MNALLRFYTDENGATAIEYGLIAAMLSVVIIGGVTLTGASVRTLYGSFASRIAVALSGAG